MSKICKRCGVEKPVEAFSWHGTVYKGTKYRRHICIECRSEQDALYRENNREKLKAQQQSYYRKNREKIRLAINRRWEQKRSEILAQQRQYYSANRQKILQRIRENPESRNRACLLRLHRKRAASDGIGLSPRQWEILKAIYRSQCAYCGRKTKQLQIEHIVAIANGGKHGLTNIVPACRSCNYQKHTKPAPSYQPVLIEMLA